MSRGEHTIAKRKKQQKKVLGRSIGMRPVSVEGREEFGHWEGDGIVGKGYKGQLIILVERTAADYKRAVTRQAGRQGGAI